MKKTEITNGICYLEVPELQLRILCGCPENSIKFIMQKGLTPPIQINGFNLVGGPNAILLNDISILNSHFLNFAEFPVLHHQYFQGAAFTGTGEKFTLIGMQKQVDAQYEYILRGLYGITDKNEILDAGLDDEQAERFLAIGNYHRGPHKEFNILNRVYLNQKTNIKDDLYIERVGLNKFEFTYKEEKILIDINLKKGSKGVGLPYNLKPVYVPFDDFSVTTVGDGNGWNPEVPCMGAVITTGYKRYLVDSGPGSLDLIKFLGISTSEVEGVFVTHSHDDHFAGILSLLNSERRIKFFSSNIIIKSVQLKFQSLLNVTKEELKKIIDFIPLRVDEWNNIGDMEVKPEFSFHTIETNIFYFRKKDKNGNYKTYGHITDIISRKDLNYMLENDQSGVIRKDWADDWFNNYLEPCSLKRIDAGGGVVHGDSHDFVTDSSDKIILSHLNHDIDTSESSRFYPPTDFGYTEDLINDNNNHLIESAKEILLESFIDLEDKHINNSNILTFKPGEIIYKKDQKLDHIYLLLSGVALAENKCSFKKLIKGNFLYSFSNERRSLNEYTAVTYINVLKISYKHFKRISKKITISKEFHYLRNNCYFTYGLSFRKYWDLSKIVKVKKTKKGSMLDWEVYNCFLLSDGTLAQYKNKKLLREVNRFGLLLNHNSTEVKSITSSVGLLFNKSDLYNFTSVLWSTIEIESLFETIVETGYI